MAIFSEAEVTYLTGQPIGRLATLDRSGDPQVKAIGYTLDPATGTISIGGYGMGTSQKYRNVAANPSVSLLVDDVTPDGKPGFVEIRGVAETVAEGGEALGEGKDAAFIRIHPRRIIAWDAGGRFPNASRDVAAADQTGPR